MGNFLYVCTILKTYGENRGLLDVLLASESLVDTGRRVSFGYVQSAPVVRISGKLPQYSA